MYYHGSKRSFTKIRRQQKVSSPDGPKVGRRNAIYLSPCLAFALFFAAKPAAGLSMMSRRKNIVYFEHLEDFDLQENVFIYIVDPSGIPEDKITRLGKFQIAVDMDEIEPVRAEVYKAGEIFQYFEVIKTKKEYLRRRSSTAS